MVVVGKKDIQQYAIDRQFEPSRNTKLLWRFTRKTPSSFASITLPGLFQTSHFTRDTACFLATIVLELWGLNNFLRAGQVALLYVAFLFLLDIALAVLRHLPLGRVGELRNRLVFERDEVEREKARHSIRLRVLVSNLFAVLIGGLAAFKVLSFSAVHPVVDGLTLGIMTSYAFVAILHITVTGYFLAGLVTDTSLRLDRSDYIRRKDQSPLAIRRPVETVFETGTQMAPLALYGEEHGLYVSPAETPGRWRCVLRTWGVLRDQELHTLIREQQSPEAMAVLALHGVQHQVEKILQPAVGN
jgi:hypothetical protein